MMYRSTSRRYQPNFNENPQERLEKLLVEQVEMTYPQYGYKYDIPGQASAKEPDVLIVKNTRGHKTIVWHETDEWEHSGKSSITEVQREFEILYDVNKGNSDIHLIRCNPYDGRRRNGVVGKNVWYKQFTISSVLCSLRLILELLDKGPVLHTPDDTRMIDQNSKVNIYNINYSRGRVSDLKQVRSNLVKQHRGGFSGTDHWQPAPQADAQPNPEEARHGAARHAHHERAQSWVDPNARQSQEQQPSQGGSSGTAFACIEDSKVKGAARGVPDPASAAVSSKPSGQGITKPFPAAKGAKVLVKPPNLPKVPQASACRHSDLTRASKAADNSSPIKESCPCCFSRSDYYDKNGNKLLKTLSINSLTIELCPRPWCA